MRFVIYTERDKYIITITFTSNLLIFGREIITSLTRQSPRLLAAYIFNVCSPPPKSTTDALIKLSAL